MSTKWVSNSCENSNERKRATYQSNATPIKICHGYESRKKPQTLWPQQYETMENDDVNWNNEIQGRFR